MKNNLPQIDLITVNHNGLSFLEDFFKSLNGLNYPKDKLRVFFVDNASNDGSLDFVGGLKADFNLQVVKNRKNFGFAAANNMVFPSCRAKYIALLNNDTRVKEDWLVKLVEKAERDPAIGIAGSKRIPVEAPRYIDPVTLEASWCSGGGCLIRKDALEATGYFDEKFFMYGEDNDLSWRMWLCGWKCAYVPESIYEHHFGKPEKYSVRRNYFHVRNSILLRYIYGSFLDIWRIYIRWFKEGLSLGFKKYRFREAAPVFGALLGHIPYILHFERRKRGLILNRNFKEIKEKWIRI